MAPKETEHNNPSGSEKNKKTPLWKRVAAGGAAIASLNMLAACGDDEVNAQPEPTEPVATSTLTPGNTTPEATPTPSQNETTIPPATETTKPVESEPVENEKNPNVRSFEEDFKEHLKLDRETVRQWIETDDFESIANAIALETLNISENTSAVWISKCKTNPVDARTSIYKSIDSMTGPELACQGMIGGGMISSATKDGKIYEDDIAATPHDTKRAAVLADLTFGYWGAKDKSNYGGFAYNEFLRGSQLPYSPDNRIAMVDYGYTQRAKKVDEGEVEINGSTYKTVDIEMGNILQDKVNTEDRAVIQFLRIEATKSWQFDSGASQWERWGEKGLGSMVYDKDGKPVTSDGSPVEILIPYQSISTFDSSAS